MLSQRYPLDKLRRILLPRQQWTPFPPIQDRGPWEGVLESARRAHIRRGEAALGHAWPALPATLFLDYARTGTRRNYERESFGRREALRDLVLAECLEAEGRFLDDIANGIWAICEETFWGVPAHIAAQKAGVGLPDAEEPIVDLFAGETVGLLAWTHHLLGPVLDKVSPLLRPRIRFEADRRVLTPCLEREDFWWMGFAGRRVNNWNPWCNSNWLTAALLLEEDSERRLLAVDKALRSLDRFIDPYPADGGCDEGPSYWGRAAASLFDCLELLIGATDWGINVYEEPLIRNMGLFIARVQISGRYFLNFADAPAMVSPSAPLVYQFGCRIGSDEMKALGAWAAQDQGLFEKGLGDSIGRALPGLFILRKVKEAQAREPLPRDAWLDAIQVMVTRDVAGADGGLFVAAKGGHNAESHNHNDVGSFVVYRDGRPVLIDAGVEAYSAKTFGPNRYDIWTMQSAYHNLPTVGGAMQSAGHGFAARNLVHAADDAGASLAMDIEAAYPPEAGIASWRRTVSLRRGVEVTVEDAYQVAASDLGIVFSLITPCEVAVHATGQIGLGQRSLSGGRESGTAFLRFDGEGVEVAVERIDLADDRLRGIWGDHLTRILLALPESSTSGRFLLRIA